MLQLLIFCAIVITIENGLNELAHLARFYCMKALNMNIMSSNFERGISMSSKNSIYGVILLTVIWIILRETIDLATIATGVFLSLCCVYFCRRLIPLPKTPKIKFFWFMTYLFFLFGQVYLAGLLAIKIILTDAHVEIVEVKTKLSSIFFKTLLVNSITLVPGSISLGLKDDKITVLWLKQKTGNTDNDSFEDAEEILLSKLQKMLIKAER